MEFLQAAEKDEALLSSNRTLLTHRSIEDPFTEEETAQRLREDRARHAANVRHSKSKSREARKDKGKGKNPEKLRENNRVAAAKCRQKKKDATEELNERGHKDGVLNKSLKDTERACRNELSGLRSLALQHVQGLCQCTGIHNYNQTKAQQQAQMFQIMGAMDFPGLSSPSQDSMPSLQRDSMPSTQTPGSMFGSIATPGGMNGYSGRQSSTGPLNIAFAQVTTPHTMQSATATATAPATTQASQYFAGNLQSSWDGHAGFS